jgi:ElaB/YqjD/DUF883 family membrane-anchored ribosome-binding protein
MTSTTRMRPIQETVMERAHRFQHALEEMGHRSKESMQHSMEHARERAAEWCDHSWTQAQECVRATGEIVRKYPLRSALITMGLLCLASAIWIRR